MHKLGIIGAGNMATSIIGGIIKHKIMASDRIYVYDIDIKKTKNLANKRGISIVENKKEILDNSTIIIIAVKPQVFGEVLDNISDHIKKNHILVSIAPGISINKIQKNLKTKCKIIRVMPNTPALIGEGMSVISGMNVLDKNEKHLVESIFSSLGKTEEVDEKYMDSVTAISGSSPAYVFMFIEALADGGVLTGLPRDLSYKLAAQSVLGAAKMVLESDEHPGLLKDKVTSPGGTTIEAIYKLEKGAFRGSIIDAVKACAKKAKSMGQD